jgi:hypothetical protein
MKITHFWKNRQFWKFYQEKKVILENFPFSEKLPWIKMSWENCHASIDIFLGCQTS